MAMLNYEELVHIDEDNLESAWLVQASRYMQAVRAECEAKKLVAVLDEKQGVIEAETIRRLREERKDEKRATTETELKQLCNTTAAVRDVKQELREAEYQRDMMKGVREALDHRRNALQDLVQMAIRNMRAEPRLAGISRNEVEQVMDVASQKTRPIRPPRKTV